MGRSLSTSLSPPQPTLKDNHSTATMATTTDSSTLAPSVNNEVGGSGEKGYLDNSRPVSPNLDSEKRPITPTTEGERAMNTDAGSEGGSEGSEDETQYPGPIALTLITIALSLAVFLVALVGFVIQHTPLFLRSCPNAVRANMRFQHRIKPLLPLLFLKLRISLGL